MVNVDRFALQCDFAETYNIYDYRALPARLAAVLACGLKADSRIMVKMAGVKVSPPNLLLLALIVDELRAVRFGLMGDKKKPPTFITNIMENGIPQKETQSFKSGAEFEKAMAQIREKLNNV